MMGFTRPEKEQYRIAAEIAKSSLLSAITIYKV